MIGEMRTEKKYCLRGQQSAKMTPSEQHSTQTPNINQLSKLNINKAKTTLKAEAQKRGAL